MLEYFNIYLYANDIMCANISIIIILAIYQFQALID